MSGFINVKSEIGKLRRVMLHRPGVELSNLMPDYLERMLAEDTPDVKRAGEEHDVFANILRSAIRHAFHGRSSEDISCHSLFEVGFVSALRSVRFSTLSA